MKIIAIWRTLILALAATVAAAAFFYWWEHHYFEIVSREASESLIKWWWLAAVTSFAAINLAGVALILIGNRPGLVFRLMFAAASFLFPPTLILYWLLFVECFRPNNSLKPSPLRGLDDGSL